MIKDIKKERKTGRVKKVEKTEKTERVAFTVFRNNLAVYLEKLAKGSEIEVFNARRGRRIVSLKGVYIK